MTEPSREELTAMIAHAHKDAPYAESALAGKTLAAQSQLPKIVAENLGAGFGQWDFFPEAADVVEFALAYVAPETAEDVWKLARAWADDDAHGRRTVLALIGRDVLQHELRRIEIPELRALIDESNASRARDLRVKLGLAVAGGSAATTSTTATASVGLPKKRAAAPKGPPRPIPDRMPKPEFRRPAPPPPPAAAKRYQHPKFGEGVLVGQQGAGEDAKLTIEFASGEKTLLARFVTEVPP